MMNKSQGGHLFFVYQTQSRTVHEYKDLSSLLEGYENSHSTEDLFWTLGLRSWIPVGEAVTDNVLKKKKFQIPALPATNITQQSPTGATAPANVAPMRTIKQEQDDDFKIVSYEAPKAGSAKVPHDGTNKRKSPRYDIRLKVIISNKEKTFLSYTSNVSVGGVALEDNIPKEYFHESADTEIFISSPKKNEFLAFRCQPVGDEEDPKRFSFGEISEQSLTKFQDWIDKLKTAP